MSRRLKILASIRDRLRAIATPCQFQLLDLPNELISAVLEQVDALRTLKNIARTCRRLQALADRQIHRALVIRGSTSASQMLAGLSKNPRREVYTKSLYLPCDVNRTTNWEPISEILYALTHLRALYFESPNCSTTRFENESEWQDMMDSFLYPLEAAIAPDIRHFLVLRNLRSVTLHLNGVRSPYWAVDERSSVVFKLPAVESITLSCASLPPAIDKCFEPKYQMSTPLKHLILIECNISHAGLHTLLGLPKALESVYIGENSDNERFFDDIPISSTYNGLFLKDARASLEALKRQSHSLKSLSYAVSARVIEDWDYPDRTQAADVIDGGFSTFNCLEDVTLIRLCYEFERGIMTSRAPPNLRILTYKDYEPFEWWDSRSVELSEGTIPFFRAPSPNLPPRLEQLNITVLEADAENGNFHRRIYYQDFLRKATMSAKAAGVQLHIRYTLPRGYFPPFLWGEEQAEEHVLYDPIRDIYHGIPGLEAPRPGSRAVEDPDVTLVI